MTNEVDQRRRDISGYLADHPEVSMRDITKIVDALNLNYKDVQNDILFLKEKLKIDYSQYNISGLRDKAKAHVDRLKELEKIAKDISEKEKEDVAVNVGGSSTIMKVDVSLEIRLKAIDTQVKLIHNIYKLEHDGIGELTDEINGLGNKKDKETQE